MCAQRKLRSVWRLISTLGLGVDIGGENVSSLLYTDDLVILAENEQNLQALLDILKN